MTLPTWVSQEAWDGYLEMRRVIKKPMTKRAMELAIKRLDTLRSQGWDPSMVLDQSTFMSWQGLWPLKEQTDGRRNEPRTFAEKRRDNSSAALNRVFGDFEKVAGGVRGALPAGNKRTIDPGVH